MHCRKCDNKMILKNNSMYCQRSHMLPRTQNPRGRFRCTACGQHMKFTGGYLQCPAGHDSLNDSIFDLNQLCPHDRVENQKHKA